MLENTKTALIEVSEKALGFVKENILNMQKREATLWRGKRQVKVISYVLLLMIFIGWGISLTYYAFANDGKRETHIFSHHVVSYKDRASGAEGSAEVCGLFKCGTDLIFECNEMTTVTRGAMGANLGSATA